MMRSEIKDTEAFIEALEAELENPEMNGELDSFLDDTQAVQAFRDDDSVLVIAHNGMSEDMKEIDALYIIESDLKDRAVHILVTWEVKSPKNPKDIVVEFLTDGNVFKKMRMDAVRKFRNNLADGDYCQRDMDMGLVRLRGHQQLYQVGGVSNVLDATLGRNSASILSFLDGNQSYKTDDLSYDNSWGSW